MHSTAALTACVATMAACVVTLTGACSNPGDAEFYSVRDSAGVAIAESTAPQWSAGEGWTLAQTPHLEIGASDAPGHDLYEVTGIARLADGRIVVANGGSSEIRIFSEDGALLRTLGRPGEGPGEFRALRRLFLLPGDSILVADASLDRLTVFSPLGDMVRTAQVTPPPSGSSPLPAARMGDGSLVALPPFTFGSSSGGTSRVIRDTVPLMHYDRDGRYVGELGRFPGSENFVFIDPAAIMGGPRIWGRRTHVAAGADGFVIGHADDFSFFIHSAAGDLRRIIRANHPPRPITNADIERLREPEPGADPGSVEMFNRVLATIEPPSHFPAYAGILVDDRSHLWIGEYVWPEGEAPQVWQVFDPDGRWLGPVSMPAGFSARRIGTDEVMGIYLDDMDIEHVHAYRLSRDTR